MTPKVMIETRESAIGLMPQAPSCETAVFLGNCDPRIVFLRDQRSPAAEEYRRIVSRLASQHPAGGTLMVTSPTPGDGKTLTSINLALAMAERTSTLLLDLDTRHSKVGAKLNIASPRLGVEDALLGAAPPEDCLLSIPETRLTTCLNRRDGQAIIDLMVLDRPKRFLEWALQRFNWVIIDTPPAFPIADTLEIANYVDIGMLVVRARKTPVRLVKQAMEALKGQIHYVMFNDNGTSGYSNYNHHFYVEAEDKTWRRK